MQDNELEFRKLPLVDKWGITLEIDKKIKWAPKESYPAFNYMGFMQQMKHIEDNWEIIAFEVPTTAEYIIEQYQGIGPVVLRVVTGVQTAEPRFIVWQKKLAKMPKKLYKYLGFKKPDEGDFIARAIYSETTKDSISKAPVVGVMTQVEIPLHDLMHCFAFVEYKDA